MHQPGRSVDEGEDAPSALDNLRARRKQFRGKITRSVNRIKDVIRRNHPYGRIRRELTDLKRDFSAVRDIHSEMYMHVEDQTVIDRMNDWESDLVNEFYSLEEECENYEQSQQPAPALAVSEEKVATPPSNPSVVVDSLPDAVTDDGSVTSRSDSLTRTASLPGMSVSVEPSRSINSMPGQSSMSTQSGGGPFDRWIDELTEFTETSTPESKQDITIAEALFKLESSREIPQMQLPIFDGDPLRYVEFIERFRIQIHDKPQLTDNHRIIQLKMHLTGDAERAIVGLGSQGIMYATALKSLKNVFGKPSAVARSFINKLVNGGRIASDDKSRLREFSLDIVNCIAALKQLDNFSDINASDTLRRIVRRLPERLVERWKNVVIDIRARDECPNIEHISKLVNKQVQAQFDPDFGDIDSGNSSKSGRSNHGNGKNSNDQRRGVYSAQGPQKGVRQKKSCYICEEEHRVADCPTFKDSSIEERYQCVTQHHLCFGCLNKGHRFMDCRSKKPCRNDGCSKSHHGLLHKDRTSTQQNSAAPPASTPTGNMPPARQGQAYSITEPEVIMPVIRVSFIAPNGKIREVIRKEFSHALGLQGSREQLDLALVGGERIERADSRKVKFGVAALQGEEIYDIEAYEVEKTALSVPALDRDWLDSFSHLRQIPFAHKAGPIDMILGIQYTHLHSEVDLRQGLPFQPIAKRSKLGWYVMGRGSQEQSHNLSAVNVVQRIDLDKFYEFETLGIQAPHCTCKASVTATSAETHKVMNFLELSCTLKNNRYCIGLPWKTDPVQLPDNYTAAEKRLLSLERSLAKDPKKCGLYQSVMHDYIQNGWACPVSEQELQSYEGPVHYLPHHGIYRPEHSSTPLRVVFDPANKYGNVSLNSFLHKGPGLIGDLYGVLLRFREDRVAFVGDISKMYMQICLPEADTHVHRYLWRDMDTSRSPGVYRLMRVPFGDKPSPDMASFVLLKIAQENEQNYPLASEVLCRDRYMDDLISSCESPQKALEAIQELDSALSTGSFKIKKWYCSSKWVQSQCEPKETNSGNPDADPVPKSSEVSFDKDEGIKTLGLNWNQSSDTFKFVVESVWPKILTKRTVLSKISMLYDPLGLASPITIKARIELQEIWRSKKFDWDDPLPQCMQDTWQNLFQELDQLDTIQYPRCMQPPEAEGQPELHVFADASGKAYGAVAYLLWLTESGTRTVILVSANARVVPLRQTTIPRLELMAALVGSRLAQTIYQELKVKPNLVTFWSDSKVVLSWLKSESAFLKQFVGVRVSEIQATWEGKSSWRYVPSEQNPADDLSRGIGLNALPGRWINGPEFLSQSKENWPAENSPAKTDFSEHKPCTGVFVVQQKIQSCPDPQKFSNWQRLVRVAAYCLRFVKMLRTERDPESPTQEALQPEEITAAETHCIKQAQVSLGDWKVHYLILAPFEKDGVVRVGGRLKRSSLHYDQIHPIILPAKHEVSKLIMRDMHEKTVHGGAERTLAASRRQYWIVQGRNLAKQIVRSCTVCRILRQKPHATLMADLPPERLKPFEPPFHVTGVDLFGPFWLKISRNKNMKAWGAIFTCASTRAIHLELVEDQSSQAFIQALRRFSCHHGWPATLISDNGGSFVGTRKELKQLFNAGRKQIEDFAVLHKVKWILTTPLSPHQGGIYESLIKQVKNSLKVTVGNQTLTWNEMSTVFAEAKALVNSRPIGYSPDDPNDLQPLTPNHFLKGRASTDIPQGPFQETKNLRKRFEYNQALVNHFWKRFIRDYLPTLTIRRKWSKVGRQLKVGDVVLLIDYKLPRGKWDLARITEVYPGSDGVVRNVRVQTKSGQYNRSVQKCCLIVEKED